MKRILLFTTALFSAFFVSASDIPSTPTYADDYMQSIPAEQETTETFDCLVRGTTTTLPADMGTAPCFGLVRSALSEANWPNKPGPDWPDYSADGDVECDVSKDLGDWNKKLICTQHLKTTHEWKGTGRTSVYRTGWVKNYRFSDVYKCENPDYPIQDPEDETTCLINPNLDQDCPPPSNDDIPIFTSSTETQCFNNPDGRQCSKTPENGQYFLPRQYANQEVTQCIEEPDGDDSGGDDDGDGGDDDSGGDNDTGGGGDGTGGGGNGGGDGNCDPSQENCGTPPPCDPETEDCGVEPPCDPETDDCGTPPPCDPVTDDCGTPPCDPETDDCGTPPPCDPDTEDCGTPPPCDPDTEDCGTPPPCDPDTEDCGIPPTCDPEVEDCDKEATLLEAILKTLTSKGEPTMFEPANATSFWESEYEDGFQGVWDEKSESLKNTEAAQFIQQFKFTGGGAAPDNRICFNLGRFMNYGCKEIPLPSATVMAFIKICILVTAAFLCRRIIFGG